MTRVVAGLAVLAGAACAPGQDPGDVDGAGGEVAAEAGAANMLTPQEAAAGWRLLFDGETTEGWRLYNADAFPAAGWEVIDGALVLTAHRGEPDPDSGGDLVTIESFSDFELKFEFMLTESANSGVFYRVLEEEEASIWHNAPEYQVLHDAPYLEAGDMTNHLTGDNYDLHASGEKALHGPGEWNQGRIRVEDNRVEHWLNGSMTVAYDLGSPEWEELVAASKFSAYPRYGRAAEGPIGLQDHGNTVSYRNLKILPLK